MKPLLRVNHLSYQLQCREILKDIHLDVYPGEIVAIVGESGCGKTTLLKSCMGLIHQPLPGHVYFEDNDIYAIPVQQRHQLQGKKMTMIFQNTQASLAPYRKIKNQLIEIVMKHHKLNKEEIIKRACLLLEKMSVDHPLTILNQYPFELSGGLNQRIGIMLAMIVEPQLIFADEITSALDAMSQYQVLQELLQLQKQSNVAIVFVTHNIAVAKYVSSRMIVMKEGQIVEANTTQNIFNQPQHPYTKQLIDAMLEVKK